ncbi:MAG TPA: methanogenesis marker protein 11, partial [Methanomicrobiales archaeon]|nr:methanogenesis marker protein 11 [Methanomicrobiales archaeon]
ASRQQRCMEKISDPYTIQYQQIVALADSEGESVELIECFDCIGGAMWAQHHYRKSPLVRSVRTVGSQSRYLLCPGTVALDLQGSRFPAGISSVAVDDEEISVSYIGMGGGGVGASICRASSPGVLRCRYDPSGGGKEAGSTLWLPRRERVLIGVDDTDTPEEGATWTLAHNIARAVEDASSRYLSHTIVQLYPVKFRTKNCVSTVVEFASSDPEGLTRRYHRLLEKYTLSDKTGMAVYRGFDPESLMSYARSVKMGEIGGDALPSGDSNLEIVMDGRGIIGAVAAIPFYCNFTEALEVWSGGR